ncbi:MAG TPA: glycosyltransferase, partial [Pyrinomonadaceae bacterium]
MSAEFEIRAFLNVMGVEIQSREASAAREVETESRDRDAASVSVVVPCYNEERFIGKVLENLAGQYEPARYEIVMVDGQST